ncbi:hypothetical protein B0T16DRAFT_316222 [Cercophora newfieldiana]|uniref:mRNA export factor MEX67 n=1 Tax=Cercophora newfieldiana TaxID=92897 RepID=A0AA40CYR6_9PEZI|nr:hypothetical protein B0T16DRAFT_316222 [Cercophora newfieldiana]
MAPTGPRNASGNTRATPRASRGGISKRRAPGKTDRDGDVSMDAAAGSGPNGGPAAGRGGARGRGRKDTRGTTRASSRIAENVKNFVGGRDSVATSKALFNKVTLKVSGFQASKAAQNDDGGRRALTDFLERKASKDKKVTIGKSVMDKDYFWISVNKGDVPDFLRLTGFIMAGAPITVEETDEKMPDVSSTTLELKAKLTEVLAKRYNPEQRLLDLSALGTDEILRSMDVFSQGSRAEKAFRALLRIATDQYKTGDEKKEAFQAVSIARNDINDVGQVFQLAIELPRLKRLDLSGNNLDTLAKMSKWRHRFKNLEELHLTGNPVTALSDTVSELLKWFPNLQNLNSQQVRTPEEVAESLKAQQPTPIPQLPSNLRDGDNNVAPAFLQAFFPLFDTDRDRLISEFYDDDSWFSLSAMPGTGRALPWKSYMKYSRNIQQIGSRSASTQQRLFTGGSLIADLWKALPPTRHPGMDQPNQWLIDCHTFPNLADPSGQGFAMGLQIIVQGQYEEADLSANVFGTRTFSRTFILGPSKPNNPPPQHPYRVMSDQLTLHNWTPAAAPASIPTITAAPQQAAIAVPVAPQVVTTLPVQPAVSDDALKAQLIQEVSKRTGMTAEYSELCLSGTANWNFELALKSFEEQKGNLPPTAFIAVA